MAIHYKKHSSKLLEESKKLFGDIVVDAFVCRWGNETDLVDDIDAILSNDINLDCVQDDVLYFDFIQLKFINGRIVEFAVSEYGWMSTPKLDNYISRFITL